tara:strand:- start:1833 stop:1988 length:156 start_codon:yes stop_codon:yes gene_type:complete
MAEFYRGKMDFHLEQWQLSMSTNKPFSAEVHVNLYWDCKRLYDLVCNTTGI